MTRQGKILLVCLAGLLLALAYSYLRSPEQQRIERTGGEGGKGRMARGRVSPAGDEGADEGALPRLRLKAGHDQKDPGGDFVQSGKDLFAPLYSGGPKLSPPSAPVAPPSAVSVTGPEDDPVDFMPTIPSVPVVESAPQPVRFEVLGYLETEGRRVVFLETGGEIFLARRGESFGDEFRVVEMSDERLVVSQRGVPRPITLELTEERGVSRFGSADPFSDRGRNVVPETRRFR